MRLTLALAGALAITTVPGRARADDKADAQALVTDGVKLLKDKQYDDALAKFQAAYAKFPSPKILLNLGATLRDMGRLADAANTYNSYLTDPDSGADRIVEVKQILSDLDKSLVLLTLEITPAGAFYSIDGGEWLVGASSQVSRVTAGKHLVRARKAGLEDTEVTVEGSPGDRRTVSVTLKVVEQDPGVGTGTGTGTTTSTGTGTGKGQEPGTGTGTHHVGHSGDVAMVDDGGTTVFTPIDEPPARRRLPDLLIQTRIDGKLRGAAGAIGLSYEPIDILEVELAALLSNAYGVYAGAAYRFLDTRIRPHVAVGLPIFFSDGARVGARIAAGGEYEITPHFRVMAELGFEHFFNPEDMVEANVFVPIVGFAGRL